MAATFKLINQYTVTGSGISNFSFTSIPSTYTDLCIYISSRANYSGGYHLNTLIQYNSQSTSSNYTGQFAYFRPGDTTSTLPSQSSDPVALFVSGANSNTSGYFSNYWSYIPDYNSSFRSERIYLGSTVPGGIVVFGKAKPGTGEAISSLTFKELSGNNFIEGSTFYLYGIKNS